MQSLSDRVDWVLLDTADADTIDDGHFHVAIITPGGGPGVLDNPVLGAVRVNAPADGGDGVIKGGAAC